jgi:MurNAc alpha-1-phosphate uridylyltransferase
MDEFIAVEAVPVNDMPIQKIPDKAMVFAAGLGTRMRPITETTPKPLVKVGGKPMIDHVLDRFAAAGVGTAIVNVHYFADQLETHLAPRTSPKIVISDERAKLLDQGGGIRKALPILGPEPFFLCNTDAFWLEGPASNLHRLALAFDPERMDILLLVAATTASVGVDWPGDFSMDAEGRLCKRGERDVAPFVYTGVGIIKPELFAQETQDVFRLAPFFFKAAEDGRLYGQRLDGLWLHVGTPETIEEAERCIARSVL